MKIGDFEGKFYINISGNTIILACDSIDNPETTLEGIVIRTNDGYPVGRADKRFDKCMFREIESPEFPPEEPQDCPFCGGYTRIQCHNVETWVECRGTCNLVGPNKPTKEEAVEAWNRITLKDK
jgi:hypothetical protein